MACAHILCALWTRVAGQGQIFVFFLVTVVIVGVADFLKRISDKWVAGLRSDIDSQGLAVTP